jgi:hypothetical protein
MNPKPTTGPACLTHDPLTHARPTTMAYSGSRPRVLIDRAR